MIQTSLLTLLNVEPALIGKCLISNDVIKINVQNVVALSLTSKIFYSCIAESAQFFETFFQLVDPTNPLFIQNENSLIEKFANSKIIFRTKYFYLRNICLKKKEIFPGTHRGVALPNKEGVEFISFSDNIKSCILKEDLSYQSITIPQDIRNTPILNTRIPPLAARSEKFLAIKEPGDSAIYVYESKGEYCLAKHEVEGVVQLAFVNELLCLVECVLDDALGVTNLLVFNLEDREEQNPLKIPLPHNKKFDYEICFGKEYLIYTQVSDEGNQRFALPLACLRGDEIKWISGEKFTCQIKASAVIGQRRLLANDDHFFEVAFSTECFTVCDIFKVNITQGGFSKTEIAKNYRLTDIKSGVCQDICFHNDRIFFGYENPIEGTEIIAYDMLSKTVCKLLINPQNACCGTFKSKFLKVASDIHYIFVEWATLTRSEYTWDDHFINMATNIYDLLMEGDYNIFKKRVKKPTVEVLNELKLHLATLTFGKA